MNILIICGESSSNALGEKLAITLQYHGHHVFSFGNHILAQHSTQLLELDPTQHSVSFGQWSKKRRLIRLMKQALVNLKVRIDKAVIIDFPSYNFNIASLLSELNIPITTFVTPNFWIWKNQRLAKRILNYSEDVIAIFKPEFDFYRSLNTTKVHYFGHPLSLDIPSNFNAASIGPTIGIFPGSRQGEVHHHLPIMLKIIQSLPNLNFIIFCEHPSLQLMIQNSLTQKGLGHIPIQPKLNPSITYAITAPGTNSLRLALHGIPLTIIGYLNFWVYLLAKYIFRLNVNFVGLPNIILNEAVFPEYIQPKLNQYHQISDQLMTFLNRTDLNEIYKKPFQTLQEITAANDDYYESIMKIILK
ncbi:MAG: hypothetical protein VW397_06715 [Candidatus Margulisiibacteriota bacterium]